LKRSAPTLPLLGAGPKQAAERKFGGLVVSARAFLFSRHSGHS